MKTTSNKETDNFKVGKTGVSIITAVLDGVETIESCINSVLNQTHENLEHIIIDGGSTDGTIEIIKKYKDKIAAWVSEPDNGMYDAMNKGIRFATGDIIGILNSDDMYTGNEIIATVGSEFAKRKVESIFADLVYVKANDVDVIVRHYSSADFRPSKMAYGWMPAHPTFFVKKKIYQQYGLFKTDYRIAADYELLARFLVKNKVSYSYIPKVFVKMRMGGASTRNVKSNWILNQEILRACAENGIKTNIIKVFSKYPAKIFQLINKPKWKY